MLTFSRDERTLEILGRHAAHPGRQYEALVKAAQGKKFILMGEATHGTSEFYRMRADITKALLEKGLCDAVAVEADWPDAWRVNRYVSNRSPDANADIALSDFRRFPAWMWRNIEVSAFVEWLRDFNRTKRRDGYPCGFYGLDLYSLMASIDAVIRYLEKIDPKEASAARERYGCFGKFDNDPQSYGLAAVSGILDDCEEEAIDQLLEMKKKAHLYVERDGDFTGDEYFSAQQNAETVTKAEEYYRAMYRGRPNTWNLRDLHMFTTLERLAEHLKVKAARDPCIAVWAHNSHLGNAAATSMALRGEFNIGQLATEKYGDACLRVGFSTSAGTVMAASDWDADAETKKIRQPLSGSYEELFSRLGRKDFCLDLRVPEVAEVLKKERLQRAIGVIYRPESERHSHYYQASLPRQFDFIIHVETTTALRPLPTFLQPHGVDMDETYPSGL